MQNIPQKTFSNSPPRGLRYTDPQGKKISAADPSHHRGEGEKTNSSRCSWNKIYPGEKILVRKKKSKQYTRTSIYAGAIWKRITMAMADWKNAAAKYWNNLPELHLSCPQRHRRLRNAASRINTAFFCYKNKISPQGLW